MKSKQFFLPDTSPRALMSKQPEPQAKKHRAKPSCQKPGANNHKSRHILLHSSNPPLRPTFAPIRTSESAPNDLNSGEMRSEKALGSFAGISVPNEDDLAEIWK